MPALTERRTIIAGKLSGWRRTQKHIPLRGKDPV